MEKFGLALLIYGIARSVIFNLVGVARSLWALTWKRVPGCLTYCNIESSIAIRGARLYKLEIWYSYVVEGKQYTSKRFAFNYSENSLLSVHKLTRWQARRPRSLSVRVNPKNHEHAVIFAGVTGFHVINLLLPLLSGPMQFVERQLIRQLTSKS
ncbi:DUF3592 domain-containing protein [Corallincola spongiicola]|uniref:DUF3592 domain-containing protein n=1 Tax=Corallincola spongiicola TaxID=2520508 RepID=A0ABY1WLT8_9GAMM|nr:DUF3592 domain-containing protein [Corallincola spongiicola]